MSAATAKPGAQPRNRNAAASSIDGYYTVAEVATMRGTDHVAAFRWLSRNAKDHFLQRGRFRVISKLVYHRLTLAEHIEDKFARTDARLDDVEDAAGEASRRLDDLARRVAKLESR